MPSQREDLTQDDKKSIQQEIRRMLLGHVASPFFNIQEADRQAELGMLLRGRLDHTQPVATIISRSPRFSHPAPFFTSRVHLESKIIPGRTDRTDVAILRTDRATLTCVGGPTDAILRIDPSDVAAVELKVCPTSLRDQREACAKDLATLWELKRDAPHIHCFFVVVDQSIAVPGTENSRPPGACWRELVQLTESHIRPESQHIEQWELRATDGVVEPFASYWSA